MSATHTNGAGSRQGPARAERAFEAPGPGSWALDAEHCERPHSRYVSDMFPPIFTEAFRAGMARYGSLLDTLEMRTVNGYSYVAARSLGAPPDAKGTPPKPVFWLLTRLHPALRRRIRRVDEVFEKKIWRDDTREFFEESMPRAIGRFERMQGMKLEALDDAALIGHLDEVRAQVEEQLRDHFLGATAGMLPVGDFIVHATAWTGCTKEEAVALLNGHSPYSLDAVKEMDAVAEVLRRDNEARRILQEDASASVLDRLVALGGPVGKAVARWLARVGQRTVTGHDISELRGIELPGMMASALRAYLAAPPRALQREQVERATAQLRARVPEEHRARFDELLAEARYVHPMRDGHSVIDFWCFGLARRAVLEAGRRLEQRGRLKRADHAVDLTHGELLSMLRGGNGPTAEEVEEHARWRATSTCADAPIFLGAQPGAPPPPEWLPGAAARAARAMGAYMAMLGAQEARSTTMVSGTPASGGRRVGTARLVLSPEDFSKVSAGDVLIARITTPAYNVLLPLLGAVVTDRGGLLSHPAIVSREYGIPGVVGTRDATTRIPDGAHVEVDGDAGTVRVLA
jgi:phosphohistidine swiveling domain-containing protein